MDVSCGGRARTVEIGGSDEGDVDTEVSVMGGAVKAEINAEGHGRPCRIFGTAVEADLYSAVLALLHTWRLGCRAHSPCWPASASASRISFAIRSW